MNNNCVIFREPHVFLDIETTGLDPKRDHIIEIGAVRVQGDRITDTFERFVHPGCSVPLAVQRLTGIRPEELQDAPDIETILPDLETFCSGAFLVAHNVSFDRTFLENAGFSRNFTWLDSLPMFMLLRPDLSHHNLNHLIRTAGLRKRQTHRAAADASDTFQTLLYFFTHSQVYQAVAGDILFLLSPAHFGWIPHIRRWRFCLSNDRSTFIKRRRTRNEFPERREPKKPVFDPADIGRAFSPGGVCLSGDDMQYRTEQMKMAKAVAETLEQDAFRLIEAGTGIGKSLAYLYPAALWALASKGRIAVSTHTKTLQHQIADRELPRLNTILNGSIRWIVLKGRENYLCVRKLFDILKNINKKDYSDKRFLLSFLIANLWHPNGRGDLDNMNRLIHKLGSGTKDILQKITGRSDECNENRCRFYGICPYYSRLRLAANAHILIVNHALALKWPRDYPVISRIIFDEAHNLEDDATSAYGETYSSVRFHALKRMVLEQSKESILKRLVKQLRKSKHFNAQNLVMTKIAAACKTMHTAMGTFETELFRTVFGKIPVPPSSIPKRLVRDTNTAVFDFGIAKNSFNALSNSVNDLISRIFTLSSLINGMLRIGGEARSGDLPKSFRLVLTDLNRRLSELVIMLDRCILHPRKNRCSWVTVSREDPVSWTFFEQPIDVAPLMYRHLWSRMSTVVLTSATLSTMHSDRFIRRRIGLDSVMDRKILDTVYLGSPFDFNRNMFAAVLFDRAELQGNNAYTFLQSRKEVLLDIARKLGGKTLFLGTSRTRLDQFFQLIRQDLERDRINVLKQGTGNMEQLLNQFRHDESAVLIGVDSLWEGVDIPGGALSAVLIETIPFLPPGRPIIRARLDAIKKAGLSPFMEYSIPKAIIRLRQGVGRLIRTDNDRGCVILMTHPGAEKKHAWFLKLVFPKEPILGISWKELKPLLFQWLDESFPEQLSEK